MKGYKMKKRNKLLILLCCFAVAMMSGQTVDSLNIELPDEESEEIEEVEEIFPAESNDSTEFEVIWPEYEVWERVTIEGKLKMKGLPLSPSLRIFMQKDSLVDISMRAPFVGEAGRLTVTSDSVTGVNKMNKTYFNAPLSPARGIMNSSGSHFSGDSEVSVWIGMVQDFLLGRFFLPGHNVMQEDLDTLVDIYFEEEGRFNVVPTQAAEIQGLKYGFMVDELFNPLMIVVLPESREDLEIDAVYTRKLKGYDIQLIYQDGSRALEATLELKEPQWGGDAPKPIEINKKFREVGLEEFLRF